MTTSIVIRRFTPKKTGLMSSIGLTPQLLGQAFPFHLAFKANGELVQCGQVVKRICPELVTAKLITGSGNPSAGGSRS
jgi:hypothetical protein